MATKVQSLSSIFDSWFVKGDDGPKIWEKSYGFILRVVVTKDIPPRHSIFSWIRGMGVTKFDELFQGEIRFPNEWMMAFPERHCSLDEQQRLLHQVVTVNKATGNPLKKLDIITQSPFIISDCHTENLSIIAFPDGKVVYDQDYMM